MRVTANAFDSSLVNQLNLLTSRQYSLQNQVSSGLKVAAPSDDPAAMENTLNYQAQNAAQTQYSSNISTLQSRATSVGDTLQSLQTIASRVGEIATLASDETKSQAELNNYADEVNQLINQAAQLVNTKDPSTGHYLFGGTASGQLPFTVTKDTDGNVSAVTYNGNSSVNQIEVAPGSTMSVDIPGSNTTGSGVSGLVADSQSGADLFNHLIALAGDLKSGNFAGISGDGMNLQKDDDHLLYQVSFNGAIQSRLATAATFAGNHSQALDKMISDTSSADLVQTMVQLSQAQTAYQAALQSGVKIMQLSILNYL